MMKKTSALLAAAAALAFAAIGVAQTPAQHAGAAQAPAGTQAGSDGAPLFEANCAACHQSKGEGIAGAFPALAGNAFVTGDPKPVVQTLLNGRGGMPAFRDDLKDDQLAAIVSFVRASWGNKAPPIAPADFAAGRAGDKAQLDRPIPAH
jgi:cytochrome c6